MESSKRNIFGQAIFWVSIFCYFWFVHGSMMNNYEAYFYYALLHTPLIAIGTYIILNILFEKYYFQNKRREFFVLLPIAILLFTFIKRFLNYKLINEVFELKEFLKFSMWYPPKVVAEGFGFVCMVALASSFYFIKKWQEQEQKSKQLENAKLAAEMELLKSQVQPHFIFNTLNNIYSLSLTNPAVSSEMVFRLSGLLSYMLYDSKKEWIPIKKELDYIQNYIQLQKIRYDERLDVSLNIFQKVQGIWIPPLLILPFVENAFKHGISNQTDKCWVRIDISKNEKELIFKIENSNTEQPPAKKSSKSGLGLENIKRRLDILYPKDYSLKIITEKESFLVVLRIPLTYQKLESKPSLLLED